MHAQAQRKVLKVHGSWPESLTFGQLTVEDMAQQLVPLHPTVALALNELKDITSRNSRAGGRAHLGVLNASNTIAWPSPVAPSSGRACQADAEQLNPMQSSLRQSAAEFEFNSNQVEPLPFANPIKAIKTSPTQLQAVDISKNKVILKPFTVSESQLHTITHKWAGLGAAQSGASVRIGGERKHRGY